MENLELFQRVGLATAIGFLVGVERGWKQRDQAAETRVAGLRTYTLIGLLGGLAALVGRDVSPTAFAAVFLVFGAVWGVFKHAETQRDGDISVTGAVAGLLVFVLGALAVVGDMGIAAAAAVVLTSVLLFKSASHDWLRLLAFAEIRSALLILAATLVALPLLPDRALDPYGAFNPRELWLLTIVIAGAGFAGYLALRILGPKAGLPAGAALGALVSSTAVTVDLARRVKAGDAPPRAAAAAALIANVVMFARVGALAFVFARPAVAEIAPALGAAALVSALFAGVYLFRQARVGDGDQSVTLTSPLDFKAVARFALILAGITVSARLLLHVTSGAGLTFFAAVAGLVDVDAVVLAIGGVERGGVEATSAARAILVAVAADTVSKSVIALWAGQTRFGLGYGGASALSLAAGAAVLMLQ